MNKDARQNLIRILQSAYSGEMAAAFAKELAMPECCAELLEMARVEQEHEDFFRSVVAHHKLLPITKRFFRWS